MNPEAERWAHLLAENLATAEKLASVSLNDYLESVELQLAFEALVMRVGDLAKRLVQLQDSLRTKEPWSSAARARDFAAHHYHRVDSVAIYKTVRESFPLLAEALRELNRP